MNAFRTAALTVFCCLNCTAAFADYSYEYFEGDWSVLPNFDVLTPVITGTVSDFDISVRNRDSQFGFRFTGTVTTAVADDYTFYTTSDDGSRLYIDGTLVVDNDGLHAPQQRSGSINLSAGVHDIVVTFFEQGGGETLSVAWSNSNNGQQPIPADGIIGAPPDVATLGQWGPVIPWPHVAVSAANLPDGRILTWSGSERATWPTTEQTYSGTWNPETGEFIEVFHTGHNMFCAHLAMAEDGRVFVNGGRNQTNSPWTSLFDYRNNSWEQIENMPSGGRWYPTTLALSDGDMFTAIGTATNQRNPERWDPVSGWQVQNGIDFNSMVLDDYFSTGTHGESHWWPLLHVAPNGKIFHSGPTPQMHWINTARNGDFKAVGSVFTDWYHKHGTTIMYDEGRLLTAGGWASGADIASTNQAFTVDLNGPAPVVALTQPMQHARKFHNGVMLPNGEVLVVGGNTSGRKFSDDGAILVAEIWNPETGTWREGAPMTIPRNYHSIALLLTDGRVLAAGSGYNSNSIPASTHQDGQVYSPPYLFAADGSLATQPVITAGPGVVETGATFNVVTDSAVDYFSLIKMSSTTHGVNTDVRFLKPQFSAAGANSYDITLHSNPNVATPGYWMLFAVNAAGTPSEAQVVRITAVDTRLENRALHGTASQSSTFTGPPDFDASNAVDGDLTGTDVSGSISHTNDDTNAWWEIDLGQVHGIETIRLWNRTDCCSDRLTDFYVLVSEQPFASQDLSTTLQQPGVTSVFHAGAAGRQLDLGIGENGRYVRVQKSTQGHLQLAEVQIFAGDAVVEPAELVIEKGVVENVGSDWQTIDLTNNYIDPVVIATPRYADTQMPAVTRVRNAAGNQFELRVQNPSDAQLSGYGVNYVVMEAGVYDIGGNKLEAVKTLSTVTDDNDAWAGQAQTYLQSYTSPAVVGQVMSANDADWSVFWASDGDNFNPPTASSLYVGKHVAEDTDATRANETLGYLVFESGSGTLGDLEYEAGVGTDTVLGILQDTPYNYSLSADFDTAVVSSAGMDGTNGGWPLLYGAQLDGNVLGLAIDEDQIGDSERNRTDDQVAYLALRSNIAELSVEQPMPAPTESGSSVTLTANASGEGTLTYSWSVGGTTTPFSTDNTFTHSFTAPGRQLITLTVRDGTGDEVQTTFTQLVHLPLTAGSASQSAGVVEYSSRNEVWAVNPDNNSVAVIDSTANAIAAEIGVGAEPRSLSIAPDGRVWVVSKDAAMINIIDPLTHAVAQLAMFDVGAQPHGIVMNANSAFVALEATGEVVQLDAATADEVQKVFVGGRPRHLSLDAGSENLFVSKFVTPPLPDEASANPVTDDGSSLYGGEVIVLDPATLTTTGTIVLQHSDRTVSEHSGPGIPNYLGPAVVSPDGTSAWVPSKQDNILAGALRGGQGLTFDQTVRAVTSKIELPAQAENFAMRVDHDNASVANHAAFGPYGIHLFSALEGNREIAVIDVFSGVELLRFDTGRAPQGVAVSADGSRLYVHNFMDRSIGVYDIGGLIEFGDVAVSQIATVAFTAPELLAANVLSGKQLFYDARDDRLAALDYMSCASCHNDGSDDGRVWDFTGVGEGLRNTISLNGRGGVAHGFLHWSANFDEVQDFEGQIRNFAGGTGLMDDTSFNAGTRSQPLGDAKAGLSPDLDALAAYVGSLDRVPASPYRDLDGQLDANAQAGALLFESSGCSGCHVLPSLTDSSDGSGLHDIGTISASSGSRLGGALTGIDTPTLLGAWHTGPYLHDGSQTTLQGAIAAHQSVALTDLELDQLAALIRQLDDGSELAPEDGPKIESAMVAGVGNSWQTVVLSDTYQDMVVIAAVQYGTADQPAVARVRNAAGNAFEVRVQNPSDVPLSGYTIQYLVAEAGVYTLADDGIQLEAVKYQSSLTDRKGSWTGSARSYAQSYSNPIVLGQVMSENDSRWSVFWARGSGRTSAPEVSALYTGKHVGEDPDVARATETIGYIVVEAGSGSIGGLNYAAGRTQDNVRGMVQSPPYLNSTAGQYNSGVVSVAGMDGNNGGWPVLVGSAPLANQQIGLAFDEDQIADSERNHTTEEIAYFLIE